MMLLWNLFGHSCAAWLLGAAQKSSRSPSAARTSPLCIPGWCGLNSRLCPGDAPFSLFRTNTYEYSVLVPLAAETVALKKADEWEHDCVPARLGLLPGHPMVLPEHKVAPAADLVVIQGSPRQDGNCGILASWAVEAALESGRTARVIYPHDLDIHCCIGCYQCYNTGTCVFDDDMTGIIDTIRSASLFVVCSPVYTNTVPGGLKLAHRPHPGLPCGAGALFWRADRTVGFALLGCRAQGRKQFHLRHPGRYRIF